MSQISVGVLYARETYSLHCLPLTLSFRTKPSKTDKNEDPGASLMGLMKQMYQDGDDDMKRTIAKAWHESQEKRVKEQSEDV